jgi:hypothetical protein
MNKMLIYGYTLKGFGYGLGLGYGLGFGYGEGNGFGRAIVC